MLDSLLSSSTFKVKVFKVFKVINNPRKHAPATL